jgi:hypothetical protein
MGKRKPVLEWHYEVTVWNQTNGNVEKYLSDATEEELEECRSYFEDEPWCEVVIDRSWEEEADVE